MIRQLTYTPPGPSGAAVETMTFERLRELNDGTTQRADFHVLAVVEGGRGAVVVDFAEHRLARRSAVCVAPGAVHRWTDLAGLTGHLVLFVPGAPVTAATRSLVAAPDGLPAWTVPTGAWPRVRAAVEHLVLETSGRGSAPEVPELLLSALLARLGPPPGAPEPGGALFAAFRASVEQHLREHHDAGWYAAELGYAPRTLSRAVHAATGRTAKAYLVDRLVLEARRLLAHDRFSAARVASELGFRDPSAFSASYRAATGEAPGAWQARAITPGAVRAARAARAARAR